MTNHLKGKYLRRRSLRLQVEALKRAKLASRKVVHLEDFKELSREIRSEKILVVDDDEVMRKALQRILESEGYSVTLAEDGLGLSRALDQTPMDAILLDVNLPWVDGLELCSLIKGNASFKQVPLILVSGEKSEDSITKGFAAGADHYVGKPFEIDRLLKVIETALEHKSQ